MLTFQQLSSHARDALGVQPGREIAGGYSDADVVNLAGTWLCATHEWAWLSQATATLEYVAGQEFLELPGDFRSLGAVTFGGNEVGTVNLTSMATIVQYRSSLTPATLDRWVAVSYRASEKGDRRPVLEIYPTPSDAMTEPLTLYYHAGWLGLEEGDIAPIPSFMEPLLVQAVTCYALGLAMEDKIGVETRLGELRGGQFFRSFQRQDGQAQDEYGVPMGGIGSSRGFMADPPFVGYHLNPTQDGS